MPDDIHYMCYDFIFMTLACNVSKAFYFGFLILKMLFSTIYDIEFVRHLRCFSTKGSCFLHNLQPVVYKNLVDCYFPC